MKQEHPSFDISLNLFKAVFENAPDIAVNILNKDYTVLWANRTMAGAVDTPLAEMIGKPCYEVWRRRATPCPFCMLEIVCDTKEACIMERWLDLPNKERRYAEVKAYPIFDENGSVKHIFEILIIITDRKKEDRRRRQYIQSLEETLKQLYATEGKGGQNVTDSDQQKSLTRRETEVLKLIARGFSNQQIADILRISIDTVKTHLKNLFAKLTVSDRTQAAVWAATHDVK